MPQAEIDEHIFEILQAEAAAIDCAACKGECKRPERGFYPAMEIEDGHLHYVYRVCDRERKRRAAKQQDDLFRFSNIPARFLKKSFKDYRVTRANSRAVELAKWLTENKGKGAYFYGPTGCGKTYLAALIALAKLGKGETVVFASMPDLLADIKASYDTGNTVEVLETVMGAAVLVIDDVGAERMTEWVGEQFFSIINRRDAAAQQTIITSNYPPEKLAERLAFQDGRGKLDMMQGERIVSRIFGLCAVCAMGGEDYRLGGS